MSIQVADWMVLLSSLPVESWSAEQVLALDRARWQIELLFKRIKQLVRLHRLRSADLQSNQAVMAAVLVGWALMEAQATKLRRQIQAQRSSQGPAAHQQLAALCSVDPEPAQHAAGKVELGADPDASGCPHRLVDGSSPTASSSGEPDQ